MWAGRCAILNRQSESSFCTFFAGVLIFTLTVCVTASAQESVDETVQSLIEPVEKKAKPIKVLVLGTFHFSQAPDFNDMGAPKQQKEILSVVDRLEKFSPDKIAVEFERKDSALVDSLYKAYQEGEHELAVNEREEIGFRLANRLNHQKVHAIDYKKPWGIDTLMKWAKKNDTEFLDYVNRWNHKTEKLESILQQNYTVGEILALWNSDAVLDRVQRVRMRMMEVGADKNYIGIEPVSSVYKRNMRIFANLTSVAEPGDRVLVVYGAGHSYFFNNFVRQHPGMELENIGKYLPSTTKVLSGKGKRNKDCPCKK